VGDGDEAAVQLVRTGDAAVRQGLQVRGETPGPVRFTARHRTAASAPIDLTVIAARPDREGPTQIRIVPSEATLTVGQVSPAFDVQIRRPGETNFVTVDMPVEASDANILERVDGRRNAFRALKQGTAQVRVKVADRTAWAQVAVVGNLFERVKRTDANQHGDAFDITVEIEGSGPGKPVEYRLFRAGESPAGGWLPAEAVGDRVRIKLTSPRLRFDLDNMYQLTIEARTDGAVQRYPYWFGLRVSEGK
jgi:hypothetical protein